MRKLRGWFRFDSNSAVFGRIRACKAPAFERESVSNMKIVVIDGQGGRLGRLLVEGVKERLPQAQVYALGTNSIATAAMLKAGADFGATGENPVVDPAVVRPGDPLQGREEVFHLRSAPSLPPKILPDCAARQDLRML